MTFSARFCISLLAVVLGTGFLHAQPGASGAPGPNVVPPPMPETRTAADIFREFLAMPPAERAAALDSKSEHQRDYLAQKVQEYEALPPAQREARLTQLEFRSHLFLLMNTAPANRAYRLSIVPTPMRPLIEQRLQQWDLLPPQVQKEALGHEISVNYLLRGRPPLLPETQRVTAPAQISPVELQSLQAMSPQQRGKVAQNVNQFFAMPAGARQSTLEVFSPKERQEMEKTLSAFEKLTPEQRESCIASFEKLSSMTKEERAQFLRNAERWRAMSPREREAWRTLVTIIPPSAPISPPLPAPGAPGLEQLPALPSTSPQ
jgi:hypothetical protein